MSKGQIWTGTKEKEKRGGERGGEDPLRKCILSHINCSYESIERISLNWWGKDGEGREGMVTATAMYYTLERLKQLTQCSTNQIVFVIVRLTTFFCCCEHTHTVGGQNDKVATKYGEWREEGTVIRCRMAEGNARAFAVSIKIETYIHGSPEHVCWTNSLISLLFSFLPLRNIVVCLWS